MNFWGQVWKRVWEMDFFGLKLGLDLEMQAAHPHQKFQGVPPPRGRKHVKTELFENGDITIKKWFSCPSFLQPQILNDRLLLRFQIPPDSCGRVLSRLSDCFNFIW